MTKKELKKEAIQYAVDYPTSYGKGYKHKDLRVAYLAGAEPREKRITELEKACNETEELLTKQIEATYKVVEENNELKEKLEHRNCVDCSNHGSNIKLLKAKKIIKTLLRLWNNVMTKETVKALITEAEQFLKENPNELLDVYDLPS